MDASTPTAANPLAPIVFVAHNSHRVLDAMSGTAHGLAAVVGVGEAVHSVPGLITGSVLLAGGSHLDHRTIAVAGHAGLAADAGIGMWQLARGAAHQSSHHGAAVAGELGSFLRRTSHKLAELVPLWTIGVGALDATDGVMQAGGVHGLAATESGRRGVLDVVGGALMLVPHPAARAVSAGLFATSIANDLGAFGSLGGPDAEAVPHH